MSSTPETLSLAGKVAIVTGSGRTPGLGSGIATALARNGAAVAVNYVSASTGPQAEALAARLRVDFGVHAIAVQADVATPAGAELLVRRAVDELALGKVHVLGRSSVSPQEPFPLPSNGPHTGYQDRRNVGRALAG